MQLSTSPRSPTRVQHRSLHHSNSPKRQQHQQRHNHSSKTHRIRSANMITILALFGIAILLAALSSRNIIFSMPSLLLPSNEELSQYFYVVNVTTASTTTRHGAANANASPDDETAVQRQEGLVSEDDNTIIEKEEAFEDRSDDGMDRSIALLLSFPNSGTSYTLTNVQMLSRTTAASNYGREIRWGSVTPVRPDLPNGPWIIRSNETVPRVVLTKSHCIGYCDGCPDLVMDEHRFARGCFESYLNDTSDRFDYMNSKAVDRAVHLFRNPFDNLISRMHLGVTRRLKHPTRPFSMFREIAEDSTYALLAWCNYTDRTILGNSNAADGDNGWAILSAETQQLFADVPCSVEIFRLVQWHNLALQMTTKERIPVYYIYYENYQTNYQETVDGLMQFLEMDVQNTNKPFVSGKSYMHLFSNDHARKIARFARAIATRECWRHLQHYFQPWLVDDDDDSVSMMNGLNATPPQVVWLLSFPNSGTTYTLSSTEWMSNHSYAVNYEKESDGLTSLYSERPNGLFIHNTSLPIPRFVLTKTHCAGYCDMCMMSASFTNHTSFEIGCGRGEYIVVQNRATNERNFINPWYPASVAKKVVHLIRSPFDNIVSRMHHGVYRRRRFLNWSEAQLAPFTSTKEGLQAWCRYENKRFWDPNALQVTKLSAGDLRAIVRTPCGADFFRYVQWHNNALALMAKMAVPTRTLFYEDYSSQLNQSMSDLLAFLELPTVMNAPLHFATGKTYVHFFDIHDRRTIWDLIHRFATAELWERLQKYSASVVDLVLEDNDTGVPAGTR